ncbi:hypothetical protein [Microvirga massiliensis]|nr:hypothetical protein [Microvirga massiliensis]
MRTITQFAAVSMVNATLPVIASASEAIQASASGRKDGMSVIRSWFGNL